MEQPAFRAAHYTPRAFRPFSGPKSRSHAFAEGVFPFRPDPISVSRPWAVDAQGLWPATLSASKHVQAVFVAVIVKKVRPHRQGTRIRPQPDGGRSLSCNQTGDGPFFGRRGSRGVETPDTDPAGVIVIDTVIGHGNCPLYCCHMAVSACPMTTGPPDRANPRTSQSMGRLGVIAISITGRHLGGVITSQSDERSDDLPRGKLL